MILVGRSGKEQYEHNQSITWSRRPSFAFVWPLERPRQMGSVVSILLETFLIVARVDLFLIVRVTRVPEARTSSMARGIVPVD